MLGQNTINIDFTHNTMVREIEELIAKATPAEAMLLLEKKTQLIGRQAMQWFCVGARPSEPVKAFEPSAKVQHLVRRISQFLPH